MSAVLPDPWCARPELLETWLAGTEPSFVYARGARPANSTRLAVVALVQRKLVVPAAKKIAPQFYLYEVQRTQAAMPRPKKPLLSPRAPAGDGYAPIPLAERDEIGRDLLALLKRLANTDAVCPTDREIARQLGLPDKDAANYQLRRLVKARQIEIDRAGPKDPRIITIRATGQTTGSPS